MNELTQVYDEFVVKHQAAYAGFSSIYESKNPRPVKPTIRRDFVSLLIVLALTVVMGASIIVSGSRTIAEFGGAGIGTVAFVMIECGIAVYALFRARRNANPKRLQNTVKWATVGLVLTFLIGVAANIDATLKAHSIVIDSAILSVINLAVAVSAPALAFISSDVLAIELMATDIQRREAMRQYDERCLDWQDGLNRSWNGQQKNWGVRIEVPSLSNGIPLESNGNVPSKSTLGHTKKPDATKRVMDYLADNPDAIHQNPLEIASLLEVGKSTVYAVFKEVKSQHGQ